MMQLHPKDMNTIENPIANNIIGKILIVFLKSSFNELPEI